ncbi:MAG: 7-cyano-7-deazaguanine synthase QueC [Verrucomicrobiota bacterium]
MNDSDTAVLVLVSGGMDSVTALYHAHQQYRVIGGLSFHYGSKHNDREIPFAIEHCRKLGIPHRTIDLPFIDSLFQSDLLNSGGAIPEGHYEEKTMKQTVVPFRNGIMLSIAAGYAESQGARGLVIAAHSGDHAIYPDCRETFMAAMNQAIQEGTYEQLELIRPFIKDRKEAIALKGQALGIDFSRTWSCYKGLDLHCGLCGTCVERREAFQLAGMDDPTIYKATGPLPSSPSS